MDMQPTYTRTEVKKMEAKARYDELYRYAILTYDKTGRIAKKRLDELKKEIGE